MSELCLPRIRRGSGIAPIRRSTAPSASDVSGPSAGFAWARSTGHARHAAAPRDAAMVPATATLDATPELDRHEVGQTNSGTNLFTMSGEMQFSQIRQCPPSTAWPHSPPRSTSRGMTSAEARRADRGPRAARQCSRPCQNPRPGANGIAPGPAPGPGPLIGAAGGGPPQGSNGRHRPGPGGGGGAGNAFAVPAPKPTAASAMPPHTAADPAATSTLFLWFPTNFLLDTRHWKRRFQR